MMTIIAIALLIAFIGLVAAIAANPLFRTLSIVIDNWADEVQGETEQLR